MASIVSSPNMALPIPVVGQEPGPDYATDVNNSLTILDGHNHSSGSGVQITPSGLNINADLPLNNNNLTTIKTLSFQAQLSNATLSALYTIGVDLYFNDGSGNVIRVTQSGSVSGSSGTITGLPSGTASAAFSAGVFTFQASTNTPANIDGGSFVFRNNTSGSLGITLSPPNSLGSNYSLFLPAIPSQTNVMTLDASGNMGSTTYDAVGQAMTATGANAIANTRTRATGSTVAVGGVAVSVASGVFSTALSTFVDVPNLSVTITTAGRPVSLSLINDIAGGTSQAGTQYAPTGTSMEVAYVRDSSTIAKNQISTLDTGSSGQVSGQGTLPSFIDVVGAGTYTYKVQIRNAVGVGLAFTNNFKLVAYEL